MAKSVGDDWRGGTSTAEEAFNRCAERSQGGAIPRWRGVVIGIYELPFGRGKKFAGSAPSAVNHIVSNWMLAGTYVCRTGIYFTPSYAGGDPSNTNRRSGRPDRIADGNLANDQRTLNAWFNAAAFALPPAGVGRFGTSGNHVLEGPGLSVFHFGATKEIPLDERARLKLEMVSTTSSTIRTSATHPPRWVQLPSEECSAPYRPTAIATSS